MGLKELKKLARAKEFEDFLLSFGITKADLFNLHENMAKIRAMEVKSEPKPVIPNDETKKKIERIARENMTPEQLVASFAGESEEFYENGRKPKKNNN